VKGCSKHGNEPSSSIKCWESLQVFWLKFCTYLVSTRCVLHSPPIWPSNVSFFCDSRPYNISSPLSWYKVYCCWIFKHENINGSVCVFFQVCSKGLQLRVQRSDLVRPLRNDPKRYDAWRMFTTAHRVRTARRAGWRILRISSPRDSLLLLPPLVPGAQEVAQLPDLVLTKASLCPSWVHSMNKRSGPKYLKSWHHLAPVLSESQFSLASWKRSSSPVSVSAVSSDLLEINDSTGPINSLASSLGIVTRLRAEFDPQQGQGFFTLRYRVQTGSGVHPVSYPVGSGGLFSGGKAVGAWNWVLTSI
jgi:hypothetical protein